jgi:hypothetical protein
MVVKLLGSVTEVSEVVKERAPWPIEVTEFGIVIELSEVAL